MVGVAGKSKGCNTCRARKIACDQQKPVCARCTQSGRVCGGYQRDKVFVLVQPAAKKKHIFLKPSPMEVSQNMVEKEVAYSFTETSAAYTMIQKQNQCHNLILTFLSNCFSTQSSSPSQSWISLLAELPTEVKALEMASTAVAASAIGRRFQDTRLIRESLNLYTRALQQLQNALWNPKLVHDDGTLAACMALSLYEAMECPSAGSNGYFGHCQGLLALVQARGIQAHCSGAGHRLFLGVRIPGILYALEHQCSSFLFDSIWMEQPWEKTQKTFFSQVVDCLALARGILQRVYLLHCLSPDQQADLCRELILECWQIDQKLDTVWNAMQHARVDPLYWPVPSKRNLVMDEHLFPVVFCFPGFETAATLILLWAVRALLWSGLVNLYKPIPDSSMLPDLGHRTDYLSMAHNVCASVEYLLQDETLLAGPLSVSPAIGIVSDTLRHDPCHAREVTWLRAVLGRARQRGLGVLGHGR